MNIQKLDSYERLFFHTQICVCSPKHASTKKGMVINMQKKLFSTIIYISILVLILSGCKNKEVSVDNEESSTPVASALPTLPPNASSTPVPSEESTGKILQGSMEFEGYVRTYEYYLPSTYNSKTPIPAILCFHGLGSNAYGQQLLTGFNQVAEEKGFIVIYPESTFIDTDETTDDGSDFSWGKQWNAGYENLQFTAGVDDVGFISSLIDKLTTELNLDEKRIYATGASNGAVFTQLLALELSDKIAAVASVIGALAEAPSKEVKPLRPISVLLIMSDTDPIMPFDGLPDTFLSADQTVSYWIKQNKISTTCESSYLPQTVEGDSTKIKCDKYVGGEYDTSVVFYTVEGGGHTWPGGLAYASEAEVGKVSYQINASQVIWEFFKDITLPDFSSNK